MKVALILPANVWCCPFVNIYIKILDKDGIDYDIISWNKDGNEKQGIQFDKQYKTKGKLTKLMPYFEFASFVKKTIRQNKYDKLIVFTPQVAIFLCNFLKRHYNGRYIFDYRDLSIEQMFPFKLPFKKVLRHSYANVISSPGFKKCLPVGFEYLLSHNFDIDAVRRSLIEEGDKPQETKQVNVLTIGGIRDYSSNIEVVKSLANKENFLLKFVGKGSAADKIECYAKENEIKNIEFEGYYPKEKEAGYIKQATFLNIFYPRIITHDTALSNRFYNALIYRKPMIVTTDTTQGDYVEQNQLGLSLCNCDNLDKKMIDYLKSFDYNSFKGKCNELLSGFLQDYDLWESRVKDFLYLN